MRSTVATTPTALALARFRSGQPAYILAAQARVHPNRWSRFERGRATPSDDERVRIAEALGCRADELFASNGTSQSAAASA